MHCLADQAGSEEDQQHAGDLEEHAQVDVLAEAVDEHADHSGDNQAEEPAEHHLGSRCIARFGAEQEQHCLEALACNGHERDHRDGAGGGGAVHLRAEIAAQRPGVLAHPENHPGQHDGGGERQEPFDGLFGLSFELAHEDVEQQAGDDADGRCDGCPGPDRTGSIGSAGLHQVTEEDGEHQRDLEAFAQSDEERS